MHPYERTRRHARGDGNLPADRLDHPVVLVSHADASAYAAWLSAQLGETWRLPTELEAALKHILVGFRLVREVQ
jgi:formylglycine-generating enzyme required for sulfatase activity